MFLRLDVDHACFNKYLSYLRLTTGLPIPTFLNNVKATRQFLNENYPNIQRVWMFRVETAPKKWNEPFGLHSRGFYYFPKEYKMLKRKLGNFKYFNRHGFAPYHSGTLWTPAMVEVVEKKFNVTDLTKFPHLSIDLAPKLVNKANLEKLHHINFHPCHLKSHMQILTKALNIITQKINIE